MSDPIVKAALEMAIRYGGTDGAHHKAWVIDQMVRALTGCPIVIRHATDCNGIPYSFEALGENDHYRGLVGRAKLNEAGYEAYGWDVGIAP